MDDAREDRQALIRSVRRRRWWYWLVQHVRLHWSDEFRGVSFKFRW